MKIFVLPRLECEAYPFSRDTAVISITNPRQKPAHLPHWEHVLRLGFHDVEQPCASWQAMELSQAQAILHFVRACPVHIRTLLVHCEFGASRSAAVGQFLAHWLNAPLDWSGEGVPNPWVRYCLQQAALQHAWYRPWRWAALHRALRH